MASLQRFRWGRPNLRRGLRVDHAVRQVVRSLLDTGPPRTGAMDDVELRGRMIAERTWTAIMDSPVDEHAVELAAVSATAALGAGVTLAETVQRDGAAAADPVPDWWPGAAWLETLVERRAVFERAVGTLVGFDSGESPDALAPLRWVAYQAARTLPAAVLEETAVATQPAARVLCAAAAAHGAASTFGQWLARTSEAAASAAELAGIMRVAADGTTRLFEARDTPWSLIEAVADAYAEVGAG